MVEIAMTPKGYHIHAGEVSKHHAPDMNQATPTQYYLSNHIFHLHILVIYGAVIGTCICTWSDHALRESALLFDCVIDLIVNPPILYQFRLNDMYGCPHK
jgi:hypothetical protein